MWICNRCQARNQDGDTRCIQCAAPRSRRFGASTVVPTPSGAAVPPPAAPDPAPPPPQRPARESGAPSPAPPRAPAARWLRAVGLLLSILLPLLVIYLAWRHYPTLSPWMNGLLMPAAPAAEGFVVGEQAASGSFPGLVLYLLAGFIALLLSLLPGLSALGLGSLLLRLTPRERQRR